MPMRINIGKSASGQDELGQLSLFEGLEPARRAGLSAIMGDETHKCGDVIFNRGDCGDALYVIKDGSVRISRVSEDGHELILIVLRTGDFFGKISLLDGETRSAAAIAAIAAKHSTPPPSASPAVSSTFASPNPRSPRWWEQAASP